MKNLILKFMSIIESVTIIKPKKWYEKIAYSTLKQVLFLMYKNTRIERKEWRKTEKK